jgi:hypothetical protein
MRPPDDDPIARLWIHAMRAELDALVTRFEAQLKQHVAVTSEARRADLDALEGQIVAFASRVKESERRVIELEAALAARDGEIAALHARCEAAEQARATLDEQFAEERRFVATLTTIAGSLLFDAVQLALGQAIEHTPGCYGAIKSRKPDALLAQALRERGRSVMRHLLTDDERAALAVLADVSGCELIDVSAGARFASATMEKVATRPDPADEDHVIECVAPGLRLAGTHGAVVHPRVVVATA